MPIRVQRKRVKGWRMPENTVSVTRPGKWGNPYPINDHISRSESISLFEKFIDNWDMKADIKKELKGKNLACFCPLDQPCHADVLIKVANAD
jgi:hypothetical protein